MEIKKVISNKFVQKFKEIIFGLLVNSASFVSLRGELRSETAIFFPLETLNKY